MIVKLLRTIWPAVIWSAIIFVLLSLPGSDLPEGPSIPYLDKIIHVFLFGAHVYLWNTYLANRVKTGKILWIFFLTFLITCLYGVGMEYYQKYFVPNRGFETGDMIADAAGALGGWLLCKWNRTMKHKVV
ncbi:MAG: VanZ family protein [Chitinophagaceae bacterium]|nr:VanZ family protein [Chitinophagaceae bacterium]